MKVICRLCTQGRFLVTRGRLVAAHVVRGVRECIAQRLDFTGMEIY